MEENGEEDEMAALERKSRAILNKLTPQKFDKLVQQFKELEIDTEAKLKMCMELVFEKVNKMNNRLLAYLNKICILDYVCNHAKCSLFSGTG